MKATQLVAFLVVCVSECNGFYLPGVAPREFADFEPINVKVNKLSSTMTQLPYKYYSLPFCKPAEMVNAVENLGEVLHGSVIQNSPYDLRMMESAFKVLCRVTTDARSQKVLSKRIKEEYRVHLIMDNLPVATRMINEFPDGRTITMYERGYALGFVGGDAYPGTTNGYPYINNHLRFIIKFHKDAAFAGSRVVGFEVETVSVKHEYKGTWDDNGDNELLTSRITPDLPHMSVNEPGEIIYTYETFWEPSDIRWASRWDLYLYMGDDQIHWFSILNSLAIVLLLTGIVAMIMMRTLRRDLNRYNEQDKEELQEESGWKLVHADVLRAPPQYALLCAAAGTGMQVLGMGVVSIICAMLGFLSPANRGGLLTATILLFVLMGVPAGYFAGSLYKSMKGDNWKRITMLTASLFPGAFCKSSPYQRVHQLIVLQVLMVVAMVGMVVAKL